MVPISLYHSGNDHISKRVFLREVINAYPSAGGIAMFLQKAYGKGTATAVFALLMYFSMVINESLVARTFGQYTVQIINTYGTNIGLS